MRAIALCFAALALWTRSTAASSQPGGKQGKGGRRWSSLKELCQPDSHCEIPAGERYLLDESIDVRSLTVKGALKWDTDEDDLELRTGWLWMKGNGSLEIGTVAAPMEKKATVYIREDEDPDAPFGGRFMWGTDNASIQIHGRQMSRTWTLLSKDAAVNDTTIRLKHSVESMGWKVGDTIGIATTTRQRTRPYKITGLVGASSEVAQASGPTCKFGVPVRIQNNRGLYLQDRDWKVELHKPSGPLSRKSWTLSDAGNGNIFLTSQDGRQLQEFYDGLAVSWGKGTWETWSLKAGGGGMHFVSHDGKYLQGKNGEVQMAKRQSAKTRWTVTLLDGTPACNDGEHFEVVVEPPLIAEHMGGVREITVAGSGGMVTRHVELAAEVVNLDRSVLITGEPNWDTESGRGLQTGITGTGFMDVRYARVENCGQPPNLGRYCLHLHHMHRCPRCVLQGNAVVNSTQVGITIHGTHESLVDNNVIWNARSVGIYVEDGNEMNNTISMNTIICMHRVPGVALNPWHPGENCQFDLFGIGGRLGGIFAIGMTNNFIDNRIVNMENGMWMKGSANPRGNGKAENRICPGHAPFGKFKGNVCHDNRRFGVYPDTQMPRALIRDEDGMLVKDKDGGTDWSSCDELTADGRDNGVNPANIIEDSLDYHNTFVGQYAMTDVEYRGFVGVNNRHCMYWKSSKDFVDKSAYHMRDSMCITDASDAVFKYHGWLYPNGHVLGPAGAFTFRMKNVTFTGDPGHAGSIGAGQHCLDGGSGGPCNVQYLLEDVDFSGVPADRRYINFGVHAKAPAEVLPVFITKDSSLGGYRSVVSKHLDGFAAEGCDKLDGKFDSGYGCPFDIRRLNVWTRKDLGPLLLTGPGYVDDAAANWEEPVEGRNAGHMSYAEGYNGYGGLVIVGRSYTISLNLTDADGVYVDFSDSYIPAFFGESQEIVSLTVKDLTTTKGECKVLATEAHGLYYTRFGPKRGAPWGDCKSELALPCRTAVEGDDCYPHVNWAYTWGLEAYPDKFPGVAQGATREEIQRFYWMTYQGDCPEPCPP